MADLDTQAASHGHASVVIPLHVTSPGSNVEIFNDELASTASSDVLTLLKAERAPPSLYFDIATAYWRLNLPLQHDEVLEAITMVIDAGDDPRTAQYEKEPKER